MDPAFKEKQHERIREARLELQGMLLLAFCGSKLMAWCPILHPAIRRHFDQIEKIHGLKITNKDWMIREAEAFGEYKGETADQETKAGAGLDQQD
jgi:hypothetical protein